MQLVDEVGTPQALARKAVAMCNAEEKALGWFGAYATRTTATRLADILRNERKAPPMFRGKARSRAVADLTLFIDSWPQLCASVECGMQPTLDPKTKTWRPYGK
jgi:hypothetical protein